MSATGEYHGSLLGKSFLIFYNYCAGKLVQISKSAQRPDSCYTF